MSFLSIDMKTKVVQLVKLQGSTETDTVTDIDTDTNTVTDTNTNKDTVTGTAGSQLLSKTFDIF